MTNVQLFLKNENIIRRIKVDQIYYIKIVNQCVNVYLPKEKVFQTNFSLSEIEQLLPAYFLKIHRNCIVNIKKVIEFDIKNKKLLLINGKLLVVAVRKVKTVKDCLDPFLQSETGLLL